MKRNADQAGPVTTYWKFLCEDGMPTHGTGRWTVGVWRSVDGPIVPCKNGIHACREFDLLDWMAPALHPIALDGEIVDTDARAAANKVVARSGCVGPRLMGWNEQTARLFAADCATRVLHLNADPRMRAAIIVARGRAFEMCRVAASDAAWDAAPDAAWDAARDAAWAAARASASAAAWDAAGAAVRASASAAAWDAAWDAARASALAAAWASASAAAWDAAGDAARASASAAAWDAARAAARDAARAAAWDAARDAEKTWQCRRLLAYACGGMDISVIRVHTEQHLPWALKVVGV